jgi:hypothetical protein
VKWCPASSGDAMVEVSRSDISWLRSGSYVTDGLAYFGCVFRILAK